MAENSNRIDELLGTFGSIPGETNVSPKLKKKKRSISNSPTNMSPA